MMVRHQSAETKNNHVTLCRQRLVVSGPVVAYSRCFSRSIRRAPNQSIQSEKCRILSLLSILLCHCLTLGTANIPLSRTSRNVQAIPGPIPQSQFSAQSDFAGIMRQFVTITWCLRANILVVWFDEAVH
jgi:hypothetical protein